MTGNKKKLESQILLLCAFLAVFLICNFIFNGKLLTLDNINTIVSHAIFPIFTAWGMSFIFTTGIIDLSIGANILLSANVGVYCAESLKMGYAGLFAGTIVTSVIIEHLCVRCSQTLKIPAWISGIGVALIVEAVLSQWATVLTGQGGKLPILKHYKMFGQMPAMAVIMLIGLVIVYFLFEKTKIGINLHAIGGNSSVAEVMGINTKKTIFISTMIGGIFIGLAAIVQISFSGKLLSTSGLGSLNTIFRALATVLLAESIQNLVPTPVGIVFSGIAITGMFNILTLFGVPSGTWQQFALGVVVVICGILSHLKEKGVVK